MLRHTARPPSWHCASPGDTPPEPPAAAHRAATVMALCQPGGTTPRNPRRGTPRGRRYGEVMGQQLARFPGLVGGVMALRALRKIDYVMSGVS